MKKYIINIILILLISNIYIFVVLEQNLENNISENSSIENSVIKDSNLESLEVEEKQYPKEDFEDTFNGFEVCAKLEIPDISLEISILAEYSEEALNTSPTKFWGVNANEIGNFCVVGHNFINKNMFHDLKKLEIGDIFYIIDKNIGKVEYEIFNIYKVLPEDVSPLNTVTTNEREVTLITCTSDSKERIIVKAKEKISGG